MVSTRKIKRSVKSSAERGKALHVEIKPFGPGPSQVAQLAQRLQRHKAVRKLLDKTRDRLTSVELLDSNKSTKATKPTPPERFCAVFYDYTHSRTVIASGELKRPSGVAVENSNAQPLANEEEFEEAASLLRADPAFAESFREDRVTTYPPMPPLLGEQLPDGRIERTIAVGILPREGLKGHEIVGVNLIQRTVIRFEPSERGRAPATAAAHNPICGQPVANQPTARGVAGSVLVTVKQGGKTLWTFQVVRRAASGGTNGSGVELRFVNYKGKRVLYRAHVPILNVKYEGNACGPYRDWQNQEGMIQA